MRMRRKTPSQYRPRTNEQKVKDRERCRNRRNATREEIPRGAERKSRTDLGLALLSIHALPGVSYTCGEIAAWAGCTDAAITGIEQRALRKIRRRLSATLLRDLRIDFFERRERAKSRQEVL